VRFISTCTYYGQFHSAFFHLFKRKLVQFGAYSTVLVFRMDGEQLNFASFILAMESVGHKANHDAIDLGNPDNGFLTISTDLFDCLSLDFSPIWIDDWIDFGTQDLLERTENWRPRQ